MGDMWRRNTMKSILSLHNEKRGVSPIVATALLIGIVITLAGIVFIWAQGFIQEGLSKRGEPIERACDVTSFEASVFHEAGSYVLEVNNRADIPLYGFVVKELGEGEAITHDVSPSPVESGSSTRLTLPSFQLAGVQHIIVIPILRGQKGGDYDQFICPDNIGVGVDIP